MFATSFLIALVSTVGATSYLDVPQELERSALAVIQRASSSEEALVLVRDFEHTVFSSATLYYEVGLSMNQSGDLDGAIACYQQSLTIETDHIGALYDLAEIHFLKRELDISKQYLLRLTELSTVHWVVHYRLAQIAAHNKDVRHLEQYLSQAIHHGMPTQIFRDDVVQWRTFLTESTVALSLEMFLQAQGQRDVWIFWTTP